MRDLSLTRIFMIIKNEQTSRIAHRTMFELQRMTLLCCTAKNVRFQYLLLLYLYQLIISI